MDIDEDSLWLRKKSRSALQERTTGWFLFLFSVALLVFLLVWSLSGGK